MVIRFGDIYLAKLVGEGSEQKGVRPVIIAQNNVGNRYAPTVEIIPLSSQTNKASYMPTHVVIKADSSNQLFADSIALAEQTSTIDKTKLVRYIGMLTHVSLVEIGKARRIQSPFPVA